MNSWQAGRSADRANLQDNGTLLQSAESKLRVKIATDLTGELRFRINLKRAGDKQSRKEQVFLNFSCSCSMLLCNAGASSAA